MSIDSISSAKNKIEEGISYLRYLYKLNGFGEDGDLWDTIRDDVNKIISKLDREDVEK